MAAAVAVATTTRPPTMVFQLQHAPLRPWPPPRDNVTFVTVHLRFRKVWNPLSCRKCPLSHVNRCTTVPLLSVALTRRVRRRKPGPPCNAGVPIYLQFPKMPRVPYATPALCPFHEMFRRAPKNVVNAILTFALRVVRVTRIAPRWNPVINCGTPRSIVCVNPKLMPHLTPMMIVWCNLPKLPPEKAWWKIPPFPARTFYVRIPYFKWVALWPKPVPVCHPIPWANMLVAIYPLICVPMLVSFVEWMLVRKITVHCKEAPMVCFPCRVMCFPENWSMKTCGSKDSPFGPGHQPMDPHQPCIS
mmetsp:Transcript_17950/g.37105  ORF Transcript_17950/g.37105 Transcript_17950/m.37105 type:complete len:302 (+) Transcript_17950:83-988(+)